MSVATLPHTRPAGLTGIEHLRALVAGELPPPPMAQLMDIAPISVEEGRVVFAGRPGEQHYNPIGAVHGGYAATILDSAMGCAVQSTLDAGEAYTTLELKVNLVRAITRDTGTVLCEGKIVHRGGRVATAEARLTREADGKLLAHGTSTCLVMSE